VPSVFEGADAAVIPADKGSHSSTKTPRYAKLDNVVIYAWFLAFALWLAASQLVSLNVLPPPSQAKTFSSFEEFYPFYLTQHRNEMCRLLHATGTTLISLTLLTDLRYMKSILPASLTGFAVCYVTRSISHGFFEFGLMSLLYAFLMSAQACSIKKTLLLPITGYGFAWVGHFFFEMNRPATFVYPVYSLAGDFCMCFDIYQEAFTNLCSRLIA
jgi:hypothetical protein